MKGVSERRRIIYWQSFMTLSLFFRISFGLLVIEPYQVDVVDLARDQRSVFHFDKKSNEWTEKRVVP